MMQFTKLIFFVCLQGIDLHFVKFIFRLPYLFKKEHFLHFGLFGKGSVL
jgi:hypothetical protein